MNAETYLNPTKAAYSDKTLTNELKVKPLSTIKLIIIGAGATILLFSLILAKAKYFNKRMKWFKRNRENQNVDVEADYLINGMYL
jgi:hypothetical protein